MDTTTTMDVDEHCTARNENVRNHQESTNGGVHHSNGSSSSSSRTSTSSSNHNNIETSHRHNPLPLIRMNSLLDHHESSMTKTNHNDETATTRNKTNGKHMHGNSDSRLINTNNQKILYRPTHSSESNNENAAKIRKTRNKSRYNYDGESERHSDNSDGSASLDNDDDDDVIMDRQLSDLSPSSMEVAFSDPHEIDHSSFSRKQAAEVTNSIQTTSNRTENNNAPVSNHTTQRTTTTIEFSSRYNYDDELEQHHDDYIKSGTHFRTLLDCAFRRVATGVAIESKGKNNVFDESNKEELSFDNPIIHGNNNDVKSNLTPGKRQVPQDADDSVRQRRKTNASSGGEKDTTRNNKMTAQFAREKMAEVLSLKRVS